MDEAQRLEEAIKRRDRLSAAVQRAKGRWDAAKEDLASLEEDCRKIGVPPDQLDDVISRLEQRCSQAIDALEQGIAAGEAALAPFLEG